ncbi:hypothetical protein DB346_15525 [Verrucomicrobia bacterium LW23]|nr:hypothetical protein DB346_15525 [Verrucomicrobia bacterium LW23]
MDAKGPGTHSHANSCRTTLTMKRGAETIRRAAGSLFHDKGHARFVVGWTHGPHSPAIA